MKKVNIVLGMVILAMLAGTAQAGLWGQPLLNPSFESVENGGTPGGWGYIIDDWYENEVPTAWSNFYEQGPGIGLAGHGLIWAGTETDGMYYQPIGEYSGDETYTVDLLIGSRWGTSFDTASISLYAGGVLADAADGVDLSAITGVAQLDTVNVTTASGTETGVGTNVYDVSVNLSTGVGPTTGDLLWLEIGSVAGKDYFDFVRIPEPATLTLLGLGGLALIRRKK